MADSWNLRRRVNITYFSLKEGILGTGSYFLGVLTLWAKLAAHEPLGANNTQTRALVGACDTAITLQPYPHPHNPPCSTVSRSLPILFCFHRLCLWFFNPFCAQSHRCHWEVWNGSLWDGKDTQAAECKCLSLHR